MGEAAKPIKNWATHFCPSVNLATLLDGKPANDQGGTQAEVPEYRWIHCCNEGDYRGHHQGQFEMTRQVFEAFVANFRASPQYQAGELELGSARYSGGVKPVIQFDYEHSSEMPPWEGTIPTQGAPAPGWVLDVELREGADGKAQLWAFAWLGPQIRAQIASRAYLWVSIAFTLEGVHWITGDPIGPCLTSIAFTNHPYMQDLTPLAAANRATSQPPRGAVRSGSESPEAPGGNRGSTRTGATMDDKLRERICRALKIRLAATDDEVGGAVEEAATSGGDLGAVLEALGVTLTTDALKVIPQMREALAKIEGVAKQLRDLLVSEQTADAGAAAADVGAAMRAQKLTGDGASKAFTAYRSHLIDVELRKVTKPGEELTVLQWRNAVTAGRKAFLAEYGADDPALQHLPQTVVAGPDGAQHSPPTSSDRVLPPGDRNSGGPQRIDLRDVPGQNSLLRLVAHLRKTEKGFDRLPWQRQIERAGVVHSESELQLQ